MADVSLPLNDALRPASGPRRWLRIAAIAIKIYAALMCFYCIYMHIFFLFSVLSQDWIVDLVCSCFSLFSAFGSARSHYSVFTDQFLQNFLSGGGPRLRSGVCVAAASDVQNKLSAT